MARLIFTSKNSNSNFSVSVSSYVAGKLQILWKLNLSCISSFDWSALFCKLGFSQHFMQ